MSRLRLVAVQRPYAHRSFIWLKDTVHPKHHNDHHALKIEQPCCHSFGVLPLGIVYGLVENRYGCIMSEESSPVNNGSTPQLLLSLASASTAGTLRASVPWQQSFSAKAKDSTVFVKTFTLDEITGLSMQCRGSLVQHVHSVRCRIRKVPGMDVTYRAIVASTTDFEDVTSFKDLTGYIETYPTARAEFTLTNGTNDNTIDLPLTWPIGIGTSVTCVLPPAVPPLIVIYLSSDSTFVDKTIVAELSGTLDIVGIGHVAGHVAKG